MRYILILMLTTPVLAYDNTPKVENPETVIHKFDRFAFKGLNVSVTRLNEVSMTRRLAESPRVKVEGYNNFNLSRHNNESGVHLKLKW